MKYDAFISYSHAADGRLAPALQTGLHRLARPWYALRALHVFRDETSLAADPGLWKSIAAALAQSRYLIYMASPAAARSVWVEKELDWWLTHRGADRLLIVLSAGELRWNDDGTDFDWARSDALPSSLAGRFAAEPKFVDLRWAQGEKAPTLDEPAFRAAVLDLAAPIHGQDKDLLDGEDVRQLRRTRLLARSAMAGLATLAVAASVAAVLALQQSRVAQREARIALARQLAAQSALVLRQDLDRLPLAVLLALEAVQRDDSLETHQALQSALTLLPRLQSSSQAAGGPNHARVRAIAFSADGALLAAAREDGSAELSDLRTKRPPVLLAHDPGSDSEVVALAFSTDGRWLATGSHDHSARLWDTASGRETARLAHDDSVTSVAFHPKQPLLATGSEDGGLRLWDAAQGTLLRRFEGSEKIADVAFSPDGRLLAALDSAGCVQLVAVDTGRPVRRWCWGSAGMGLAFSADSTRLALAAGDRAGVFDLASGRRLFQGTHLGRQDDGEPEHFKWIVQVAFSADGTLLATAGRDGTARVWELANGQESTRLQHGVPVQALAFSPDGSQILTGSVDGTARLWDLPSGRERLHAVHPGGTEVVAFSPQGRLVASGGSDGSVSLWHLDGGDQPVSLVHEGGAVAAVAFAPDGSRLASIGQRGDLRIWSATGELQQQRGRVFGARQAVFSADGRHVVVSAVAPAMALYDLQQLAQDPVEPEGARRAGNVALGAQYVAARDAARKLRLWRTAGGAPLPAVDDGDDPSRIVFDADAGHVAVLSENERGAATVRVRTLPALQQTGLLHFQRAPAFAIAPGGALLAASLRERAGEQAPWADHLDLFDVASGRRTQRLAEDRPLRRLQFSRDGRHLLGIDAEPSGGANELHVWRVADGKLAARLRHDDEIDDLRVSAQGDVIATRTGGVIHLWRLEDGRPLGQLEVGRGFKDFAFSPDGSRLLTGGGDGRVVLWLWRSADLRDEACRRLGRNLEAAEWVRFLGDQPYRATCPVPARPG